MRENSVEERRVSRGCPREGPQPFSGLRMRDSAAMLRTFRQTWRGDVNVQVDYRPLSVRTSEDAIIPGTTIAGFAMCSFPHGEDDDQSWGNKRPGDSEQ